MIQVIEETLNPSTSLPEDRTDPSVTVVMELAYLPRTCPFPWPLGTVCQQRYWSRNRTHHLHRFRGPTEAVTWDHGSGRLLGRERLPGGHSR